MSTKKDKQLLSRGMIAFLWVMVLLGFVGLLWWLGLGHDYRLLQTRGEIATKQRDLLIFTVLLSLVVLLPTYFMLYMFAWRYKAGHKRQYKPNWDSNILIESIWWAIPIIIIGVLAVVTWQTSHSLDPFKPLTSNKTPIKVQVVALNWKWLFIYPEQGVASVNELAMPVDRPVNLTLTSDGPMNSFWVPQLAGQIYVMSGMTSQLHINAHKSGIYDGVTSNISGKGYADMRFRALAMSDVEFQNWVSRAANRGEMLDEGIFSSLRAESVKNSPKQYSLADSGLFDGLIAEYSHDMMKSSNQIQLTPQSDPVPESMHMTNGHVMEGM